MSIKIEQLLPLLKKGWVAMDGNCKWGWYDKKPDMGENFCNGSQTSTVEITKC